MKQFALGAGEQTVLVGQSGSGKSTLLNLIAGILLPDDGEILVNGTNPTQLSEAARDRFRAANIGYVFQSFNLLQGFTALENVLLGQMFGGGNGGAGPSGPITEERRPGASSPPQAAGPVGRRATARGDRPRIGERAAAGIG